MAARAVCQKPQEENCRAAKRPTPTAGETAQEGVTAIHSTDEKSSRWLKPLAELHADPQFPSPVFRWPSCAEGNL
jgi:hypothetical protein